MTEPVDDAFFMRKALELADQAAAESEVPVGAVLVVNNKIIASASNRPIAEHDSSAHAEIRVLRQAGAMLSNYRIPASTLYVTIEPCTMCVGAMIHARVERLVYGAAEPRAGAVESQLQLLDQDFYNHKMQYSSGVLADQCGAKLTDFFRAKRLKLKE